MAPRKNALRVDRVSPRLDVASRRYDRRGDTVSYLLTVAFVLSLFLVGLVIVLVVFGWGEAAGLVVLTMLVVLLVLAGLYVATSGGGRR